MSRILIVSALHQEIPKIDGELENYPILFTGVGKVNATYELIKVLLRDDYDLVINYGTAGSKALPIGELVDCTKFVQRDMSVMQLGFMELQTPYESPNSIVITSTSEFNPIDKRQVCGTGDSFVDDVKKENLYVNVFDMESYALAKVCRNFDVPFISFKYITDNANEHSAKDWTENCSAGIHLFKSQILSKIS